MREERTKNGVNYKVNYIYAGGEAIGFTLRGQWKIDLKGVVGHDFPFYYVKDAQGNVRKIVDGTGNCVVKYNYNAWGKEAVTPVESTWEFPLELNSDGTVKKFCQASDIAELNRLTYRGYFYNRELGLYYLINRYYDPETGRFISADDAEYLDFQTLYGSNRYIYCLNNPVMWHFFIAPNGKEKDIITPIKVEIDDEHVIKEMPKNYNTYRVDEVKRVEDYGDFYRIIFYFPHCDRFCICQKDLITQGTIEEFEEMFAGYIVKKQLKK